ncbi:autoinducer binding domain-containing protein [Phaeobacter sp. B1627]|uniref:helix-turn-helix transcriptional regulator n=1 Tax=Phaeobacter sp. B1627 TaxID=2583809 RepID=UPI00111AF269|nr:autoinducer binding domain-containing protein [Phaeobacter sp. B1627]TNJ47686.1 LuxR family transcriptional regulator [Phaeobacter sp. B1627]
MVRRHNLNAILEMIESAASLEEVGAVLARFRDLVEVDHVFYRRIDRSESLSACSTLPTAWRERYAAMHYERVDPVVVGCHSAFCPVDWRDLDWSSRPVAAYRKDALAHGLGNQGFTAPVRGPNGQYAVFSVSRTCDGKAWDKFTQKNGRNLILVAHYVNRRALDFEAPACPLPKQPLSLRETEALSLLAEGHSRARAAEVLDISEHTLRVYIEGARGKLKAQNTTHAVARAIAIGLIAV